MNVANGFSTAETEIEHLRRLFEESFVFSSDPIGWHISETANRIATRLNLRPEFAKFLTETTVHELEDGEHQCTRSRISVKRIEKDLILQLVCNTAEFGGATDEIKMAAKEVLRLCSKLEASTTPFVDDPPCSCRNGGLTMG